MGRSAQPESGGPAPILRQATPEDGFGLSELLGTLGYPCPPEEASQRVIDLRADDDQSLIVADLQGVLAGMVCVGFSYYLPLGALTCRISALAVAPQAQRRGVGRLLLREVEALARNAGAVRIELTSAAHREDAHAFYRACNYQDGALRFVKRLSGA
jgi:ribosomal protein S18 acetylase RimI-like enzyme